MRLRVLPDSLLARSFALIALLLVVSALASFQLYRLYEREPRSRELAQQTVSVVNVTRAALVNADPQRRRALLLELNEREGLRLLPALPGERIVPLPAEPLFERLAERVRAALGARTRLALARNDVEGLWVSFFIDEDEFWAMLPRERLAPEIGAAWVAGAALLLALALLGGWLIASRIARPLARITAAAHSVGRGETPAPLEERGPRELRTVAAAFNRMTQDLAAHERERALVLAGISHDLRTPLARLRLALEMSGAEAAIADGMRADIDEIDAVIGQFLDFARGDTETRAPTDLGALLDEVVAHYARLGRPVRRVAAAVVSDGVTPAPLMLARLSLHRALMNLVDNALHHAGGEVEVSLVRDVRWARVDVADRGPGIPEGEAERLKRPFTRLDDARSGPGGSGLGLAIVERVALAHGGRLQLLAREGGGLVARLELPVAP